MTTIEHHEDDPPVESGLAQRLREARRASGLTQKEVAQQLGVSRRAVSEWETGIRQPHLHVPALAALYDLSTTFLLYGVEPASVELRELRVDVLAIQDELHVIAAEAKATRTLLVESVEQIEASFAEVRLLLEAWETAARGVAGSLPGDRRDDPERREAD